MPDMPGYRDEHFETQGITGIVRKGSDAQGKPDAQFEKSRERPINFLETNRF